MEQLDMFTKGNTEEATEPKPFDEVDEDAWESSRDPDTPDRKRKASDDRQPESPPEIERKQAPGSWHREKNFSCHSEPMDTDSPASYPKHLMNGEPGDVNNNASIHRYQREVATAYDDSHGGNVKLETPILATDLRQQGGVHDEAYDTPSYRSASSSNSHYNQSSYQHERGHFQGHTPPIKTGGHYLPDMDTSPPHYVTPQQPDVPMRPRRWACDYCNIATFMSYEEACIHEEQCARQYYERFGRPPHPSRGPVPQYDRQPPPTQHGSATGVVGHGFGATAAHYHMGQDVAGRSPMWGQSGGPPMPMALEAHHHAYNHGHHQQQHHVGYHPHHALPHHQQHHHHHHPHAYRQVQNQRYGAFHQGEYDGRSPSARRGAYHHVHTNSSGQPQKRMLLAMATDSDSLSDRQCYVRSEMVEIFAATDKDVAARHSKGAQKLVEGQVGIRCVHCSHLRPRDRAERAVCYPSSVSRIYQTVADMQRFHFEQCREIPIEIRKMYKSLKTTRPRGVGSPQTYWIQSAKLLDLEDTDGGIRFGTDLKAQQQAQQQAQQKPEEASQNELAAEPLSHLNVPATIMNQDNAQSLVAPTRDS